MFSIYQEVWVMECNVPEIKTVYSITERMNHMKTGTEFVYTLVDSQIGAGVGDNKGFTYDQKHMFKSKQELIDSL
jgi:hypothetical protein